MNMYPMRYLISFGILLFCIAYAAPVSAVTFTFQPPQVTMEEGNITSMAVYASDFPTGLSGYNLTVSLTDGAVADITNVTFPSWAGINFTGSLPGDSVWVRAVDINEEVQENATDVELCTIDISGESVGSSNITIEVTQCENDNGENLSPEVTDGEINVADDSPTPFTTTFSISPAEADVEPGDLVQVAVIADLFPTGFSGYNLTVSLSDGAVANITNVTFPSWAGINFTGSLPGDSVWAKAVDIYEELQENATDVELCTIGISGESIGSSNITIDVSKCHNEIGEDLYPEVADGEINVTNDTPTPSSPTFLFSPAEASVETGDLVQVSVLADLFPTGFSGYNLTVSLSNSSVADITNVTFPSWAVINFAGSLPGDSVWAKAVDINEEVQENATDVELCTIEISGESVGESDITIDVNKCSDDIGENLSPDVADGEITVNNDSPSSS